MPITEDVVCKGKERFMKENDETVCETGCEGKSERKRGERMKKNIAVLKDVVEKYFFRTIALVAALLVFVTGCFMQIQYKPTEQVQTSVSVDGSMGTDAEDIVNLLLQDSGFDQGMFNGIGALFVGFDLEKNVEKTAELTEKIQGDLNRFLSDNMDLIIEFSVAVASSQQDSAQVMRLYNELKSRLSGVFQNTNLVELDRLEAEITYSTAESPTRGQEKLANEMVIRSVLLALSSAVYLYLQVVALGFLIQFVIGMIKRKKPGTLFYVMYLIGFFVLFVLGQLTATGLNGAAIASFVLACVFGGLHVLGQIFVEGGEGIVIMRKAAGVVSSGLLFAAACLFGSAMYNFGVATDQIGAVFGLNCFNSYVFEEGEAMQMLLVNFLPLALLHIAGLVLVLVSFFFAVRSCRSDKTPGVVLPLIASVFLLLFYVSYNICASFDLFELNGIGLEMLVIFVLCFVASIVNIVSMAMQNGYSNERGVHVVEEKLRDAERRALEAEFRAREAELRAETIESDLHQDAH